MKRELSIAVRTSASPRKAVGVVGPRSTTEANIPVGVGGIPISSVEVEFLDVGQGDSTFIKLANGKTVLVDCHFTGDYEDQLDYVLSRLAENEDGDRILDLLVITHPHEDHIGGVGELGRCAVIQEVWESGHRLHIPRKHKSQYPHYYDMLDLFQAVKSRGGSVKEIRASKKQLSSPDPSAKWYCLCPTKAYAEEERPSREQIHSRCLVLRLEYCGNSVLFTGDASWEAYSDLIVPKYCDMLPCQILQASHHGALTFFADDEESEHYVEHIENIAPDVTVISVGENSHGHPHPKALELYEEYTYHYHEDRGQVFRTDHRGRVCLALYDSGSYTVMPAYHRDAMKPRFAMAAFRVEADPPPDADGTYPRRVDLTFSLRYSGKPSGGAEVDRVRWEVQNNGVGKDHRVHDWYLGQESASTTYKNRTLFNGTHNLYVAVRSRRGVLMGKLMHLVHVRDEG